MNPTVGLCVFEELPQPYQKAFSSGDIHQQKGSFIPIDTDMVTQYIMAIIMSPMTLVPAMMMIYLNYYLIVKPFEILEFAQKVFKESVGVIILTIGLIVLIIVLVGYMGKTGYDMIKDILLSRKARKNKLRDKHHYGLLLTEDSLVARFKPEDGQKRCLYIPRSNFDKVTREYVRIDAEKPRNAYRILIYYHTNDGKHWHYVLKPTYLEGSDNEVHAKIKRWASR